MNVNITPKQIAVLRNCENGVEVQEEKEILEFLIEIGFCDLPNELAQTKIYINQAGRAFLNTYDELKKQISQQKSERHAESSKQTKRDILIAVFSFVGAFIVEYLFDIIDFVCGLFGG